MFGNILRILDRELRAILHNKQAVVILLILPFVLICFYGGLYSSQQVKNLKLGIVNESPSPTSRSVEESFFNSERLIVDNSFKTQEEAIQALEHEDIQGIIIIPRDFTAKVKKSETADVMIITNGANIVVSNNLMVLASEILQGHSKIIAQEMYEKTGLGSKVAQVNAEPISFVFRPWYNPTSNYPSFFIPGLITVIIQQVAFLYSAVSITEERKKGTLNTLLEQKYQPLALILGKVLAYFTCSLIACVSCFLAARFLFDIPMRGSFLDLFILSAVFLLAVNTIGVFISIICKDSLNATQYAMLIALPSFLLSGYTWPTQAMPEICVYLSKILPLTYYAIPVREIILMGIGLVSLKQEVVTLLVMSAIVTLGSVIIFRMKFMKNRENSVSKVSY